MFSFEPNKIPSSNSYLYLQIVTTLKAGGISALPVIIVNVHTCIGLIRAQGSRAVYRVGAVLSILHFAFPARTESRR